MRWEMGEVCMSGNSAQNRIIRRAVERALTAAGQRPSLQEEPPPSSQLPPTLAGRFFQFAEHPMTMAAIGIVGGVAAVFIYGPIFVICFLMVVLALHRSKALLGLGRGVQAVCYSVVVLFSASIFLGLGFAIEKHKEHPITLDQIGQRVASLLPKTSGQGVTNIYPKEIVRVETPPRINIGTPYFLDIEDGERVYNAHIINIGGSTARRAVDAAKAIVAEKSSNSEDSLFKSISFEAKNGRLKQKDVEPGGQNGTIKAIPLDANSGDLMAFDRGDKVIYIGLLSTYSDDAGHIYHTPRCVFYTNEPNTLPGLCQGHNTTY
jgi:hypothetical protein